MQPGAVKHTVLCSKLSNKQFGITSEPETIAKRTQSVNEGGYKLHSLLANMDSKCAILLFRYLKKIKIKNLQKSGPQAIMRR